MDIVTALLAVVKLAFVFLVLYLITIAVVVLRAWHKDMDRSIEVTFLGTGVKLGAREK